MTPVIDVRDLRRAYGATVAVDGVSFKVTEGEIFGLVGPNGAGKTTTIECIEGLRTPTSGTVRVLGMDPVGERRRLVDRIGVQLQESMLPQRLHVDEALELFGSFYRRSVDVESLLDLLGLADKRSAVFGKLSGGQKQRLFIALALIGRPELVVFDELTSGLDPQARHATWDLVRWIRDHSCTVLLTTHYMEEAERLCDRVMIVDRGRTVALDSPEALIRSLGVDQRIVFGVPPGRAVSSLEAVPAVSRVEHDDGRVTVWGHGEHFASSVVAAIEDAGVPFTDLRTEQPSLEDVFLSLTGKEMRE